MKSRLQCGTGSPGGYYHLQHPVLMEVLQFYWIKKWSCSLSAHFLLIFTIKWEFVTTVGSKICLTYIVESILAIQSTSNGTIYGVEKIPPSRPLIKESINEWTSKRYKKKKLNSSVKIREVKISTIKLKNNTIHSARCPLLFMRVNHYGSI
jgi:hypothetical protein